MKVLYSHIKKLVPGLKATAREVGEGLTLTGFMMDGLASVTYNGKPDHVISLEVRQNRPDGLSVLGVAREVAAIYGLNVKLPVLKAKPRTVPSSGSGAGVKYGSARSPARVDAKNKVRRAQVAAFTGVKNGPSPRWLKEYVELLGMNSVNLLVDISNYAMLVTGYPNHLIDQHKMRGDLAWGYNTRFDRMTTLLGTTLELQKKGEMLIQDDVNPIATLMVGSRAAEVTRGTSALVAEVAVYDPAQVRRDSRTFHVSTEASRRLEKELDPSGVAYAFEFLAALIVTHAGGTISTKLFDHYPRKFQPRSILFNPAWPGRFAGIEIPPAQSLRVLKHLRFKVATGKKMWRVTPPAERTDVTIGEDVVEEVVRLVGYQNIPSGELPAFPPTPDITPPIIRLVEKVRDALAANGLDEIYSLPLTTPALNAAANYREWSQVVTQNAINEEYPVMRQSLLTGLLAQAQSYRKKNLEHVQLFEVGKVFGKVGREYQERECLGLLVHISAAPKVTTAAQHILEQLFRGLGASEVGHRPAAAGPIVSNPHAAWEVLVNGKAVGILCQLQPQKLTGNTVLGDTAFCEVDLEDLERSLRAATHPAAIELTHKLIILDANLELPRGDSLPDRLHEICRQIGERHVWSIEVKDTYPAGDKVRYTLRVSYRDLSDPEAKQKHAEVFVDN
ncbi:MAG: hypothetical protein HY978_02385 [Candidatus Liptonbacteria bacterium]|nr:hypothetical protein [Candidatus Liptonbacteria bacterium]